MDKHAKDAKSHFIDAHFHLDLFSRPFDLVKQIADFPIYCIAMTNAPSVYKQSSKLVSDKATIRTALGFHPQIVKERCNEISIFKSLINETKYIGEIGLDFSSSFINSKDIQIEIFREIIASCKTVGKRILSIHSRNSSEQVLEIINDIKSCVCILHWYSGNLSILEAAVKMGCYFSVNSQMLNTAKGKNIISKIPIDRILTESDGPFIRKKSVLNSPLLIPDLIDGLAFQLDTSPSKLMEIIWNNFKTILLMAN